MLVSCFTLYNVLDFIAAESEAGTIRKTDVLLCERYAMAVVSDMYGIVNDGWAGNVADYDNYYVGYRKVFEAIRILVRLDTQHCPLDPKRKLHWFPSLTAEVA